MLIYFSDMLFIACYGYYYVIDHILHASVLIQDCVLRPKQQNLKLYYKADTETRNKFRVKDEDV